MTLAVMIIGGYDYWRLWILAGTALAIFKFGVCGYRPDIQRIDVIILQ